LRRYGELLWKAPELAAADDGRVIIEKHARGVAAVAAVLSENSIRLGFAS
jgi:hypothetical protein